MREERVGISMLSTNIKKYGSLYHKVGFIPLERPYYFEDKDGNIVEDDDGMIAPVKNPELVNII